MNKRGKRSWKPARRCKARKPAFTKAVLHWRVSSNNSDMPRKALSRAQSLLVELEYTAHECRYPNQHTANLPDRTANTAEAGRKCKQRQVKPACNRYEPRCRSSRTSKKTAQQVLGSAQSALSKLEQALQLNIANTRHQRSQLEQTQVRQQRLQTAILAIVIPDESQLAAALNQPATGTAAFCSIAS